MLYRSFHRKRKFPRKKRLKIVYLGLVLPNFFCYGDASVPQGVVPQRRIDRGKPSGLPGHTVILSESGFSEQLDRFIATEINSLEQLEILLFLSGNPHKWWTIQDVYNVVKSSIQSVGDRLNEMVERGFLKKESDTDTRYQFAPADENIWNLTSELRNAYKEKSVKVVQAIYSKPPDAVKEFAKAFRLRKES